MLPATTIAAISNVIALKLEPRTTMAIVGAILTPLLADAEGLPRARRSQSQSRRAPKKSKKPKHRVAAAREATDGPRERALAALKANPDASLTAVAKLAKVSRSTVVNARDDLRKPRTDRRQRAQQFLKDALAHGPKPVSDIEAAATRAHVDVQALEQARGDLGILTTRANTGGVHAVQWSLPG
jgi:hypothetical protein